MATELTSRIGTSRRKNWQQPQPIKRGCMRKPQLKISYRELLIFRTGRQVAKARACKARIAGSTPARCSKFGETPAAAGVTFVVRTCKEIGGSVCESNTPLPGRA